MRDRVGDVDLALFIQGGLAQIRKLRIQPLALSFTAPARWSQCGTDIQILHAALPVLHLLCHLYRGLAPCIETEWLHLSVRACVARLRECRWRRPNMRHLHVDQRLLVGQGTAVSLGGQALLVQVAWWLVEMG